MHMLLIFQRHCSHCLCLIAVKVKCHTFLLYSSPHWSKRQRWLAEMPMKAKALHTISWFRNYLFNKLWRAYRSLRSLLWRKECGRAVTEVVCLCISHATSTACLEPCLWESYQSVTILFIENIQYLISLVLFLEHCDLGIKEKERN